MDRHTKYNYVHGKREGEGEIYGRSNMETYITLCNIANRNLLHDSGSSNKGSVSTHRGGMEREMGGRFKREGIYVHVRLIHVERKQQNSVK